MGTLMQDFRYGLRMLAKNPGFTAVAVLTLALGIGMNTAIFSFLDPILNLRFPIKDQKQIANLWALTNIRNGDSRRGNLSIPDFLDYRQQNRVFEDLAAYTGQPFHLTNVAEPQQLTGGPQVSFNYFPAPGSATRDRGSQFLARRVRDGRGFPSVAIIEPRVVAKEFRR